MSGGKSFQPWLPRRVNFNSNLITVHIELVSANTSDSRYIMEGFHPNVNFKNGAGNESQRAKDGQNEEKSRNRESAERTEMRAGSGLIDR